MAIVPPAPVPSLGAGTMPKRKKSSLEIQTEHAAFAKQLRRTDTEEEGAGPIDRVGR